jgi:peptide/nickel transport system ATP-binding protein
MAPSPAASPEGCAFRERCPRADAACLVAPPTRAAPFDGGRAVACHHPLATWT